MRLYYSALFGATLKLSGILKYASIKRDAPSMGLRCLSRYMRPLAANYTPSVGFLPDFSSSFNIKTRHIPRWDFLFSACNLFFFHCQMISWLKERYIVHLIFPLCFISANYPELTQLVVSIKLGILLL